MSSPFSPCPCQRRLKASFGVGKKAPLPAIVRPARWVVPSAGSWAALSGIVGGVKGILGIPQRTGSAGRRDRWDRAELSANQINDQFAARAARIKADLRLTPEQAKNWPDVESAVKDIGKKNADLQIALRTERAQLKGPFDVIQQMREEARFLGERSADQKTLADAAEPLYVSLNRLKAGAIRFRARREKQVASMRALCR